MHPAPDCAGLLYYKGMCGSFIINLSNGIETSNLQQNVSICNKIRQNPSPPGRAALPDGDKTL